MEPSAELKAMSIANAPKPTVTPEGQAAAGRIAAARAERNANPTSVTADQLSQPVSQVTVPQPQVAETTPVNQNMVKGVGENTQNIIAAQTQEAADLKALRDQQAQIAGEGTLSELFSSQQEQFGIPENLKTLQDLQLQMADMDGQSRDIKTAIGQGNSISQANREITQEDRENANRQATIAARAAVLQGNIETASALVSQAVQTAYQDRTLRNSNLINQINSLQGVVDGQTSQLLEADKRQYEEDQAVIQRVLGTVDAAMVSGFATEADIQKMTDPNVTDEQRLATAQGIVARGAREEVMLDRIAKKAQITSSNASTANSLLGQKLKTFELALAGDPTAIEEVGFDPSAPIKAEEKVVQDMAASKEIERLQTSSDRISKAMANITGLKTASGEMQSPFITGLLGLEDTTTSAADFFTDPRNNETPTFGIGAGIQARRDKNIFLADMNQILTEEGFEALININERVRLTPITEVEIGLAFDSSSALQSAAVRDPETNKLTGFSIPDNEVLKHMTEMQMGVEAARDEQAAIKNLGWEAYVELQQLQGTQ